MRDKVRGGRAVTAVPVLCLLCTLQRNTATGDYTKGNIYDTYCMLQAVWCLNWLRYRRTVGYLLSDQNSSHSVCQNTTVCTN